MKGYKFATRVIIYSVIFVFTILLVSFIFYRPPWTTLLSTTQILPLSILLVFLIVLADKFPIIYYTREKGAAEVTVSFALNFLVAFLFPPVLAMAITSIGSTLADIFSKKELHKIFFNASMIGSATGITSFIFRQFYNARLPMTDAHNLLILIIASIFYMLFETTSLFSLLASSTGANFIKFWYYNTKREALALALVSLFPLGIIMIYFFTTNPWMNFFLLPTFVAIYFALRRETEIQEETKETLDFLATVVDNKIPDTFNHSKRVAHYAEEICYRLQLNEDDINIIIEAAKMHDIGKIAIPDNILFKKEALLEEDFEVIKEHTIKGEQIVNNLSQFNIGSKIIRHHHEKYDGTGYPDHLKGNDIPLGSRIIAVADAFDAMTTFHLYTTPKSVEEALYEIEINKGSQFDPHIAEAFSCIVKDNYEEIESTLKSALQENN